MSAVVISGGSAAVYPVLRALADRPRPADPGGRVSSSAERAVVLAAADPAQPYGAALAWPDRPGETPSSHRPGRKAGALTVLTEGSLVLYVERGGRTLLSWTDDPDLLAPSAARPAGKILAVFLSESTTPVELVAVGCTRVADAPAPPTGLRT